MMLENNEKVMAQATKRINEVPAALKMRSDILHAEQAKATQNSKNMISKYTKLMETMKKGYELEIENLKQQHHYLIDQKANEQKKFVADFNKYYQKKTTQGTLFFLFLLFVSVVVLFIRCCAPLTNCFLFTLFTWFTWYTWYTWFFYYAATQSMVTKMNWCCCTNIVVR